MRKFSNRFVDWGYLIWRWVNPAVDPLKLMRAVPRYVGFFRDWTRYARLNGAEPIRILDTYPYIHDKTAITAVNSHCFYQDIWAFKKILESRVEYHVDVGSRVDFVGFLTAVAKVTFIDIRPLIATLENLDSRRGNVLCLPLQDDSIVSVSCLHVAEHVGLGRYGDALDPLGTKKACSELSRILATNGNLYFSMPVGRPRVCFNAHRMHSPQQVLEYFGNLHLVEFSGIDDTGNFVKNAPMQDLENSEYACGLFQFTK